MTDPIDRPGPPSRQRSARTDPAMRDGDSGHGSPYESAGDEVSLDSDTDVGDAPITDESITADTIDNVLEGETGQETLSVNPEAFERMADRHAGPDIEAELDEEEYAAEAADAGLPIPDYEGKTVAEVVTLAEAMRIEDVRVILAYEQAHRDRATLVEKLKKMAEAAS